MFIYYTKEYKFYKKNNNENNKLAIYNNDCVFLYSNNNKTDITSIFKRFFLKYNIIRFIIKHLKLQIYIIITELNTKKNKKRKKTQYLNCLILNVL